MATAQAEIEGAWREFIRDNPQATKLDAEDYISEAAKSALADPSYTEVQRQVGGRDTDLRDWVASVIISAGALEALED